MSPSELRATSDGFEVLHRITSRSPDLLFHLRDSLYAGYCRPQALARCANAVLAKTDAF